MHLRFSTNRLSDGTVRRAAQLVQSYRRPDGTPAHRVVAHLGQISDVEVANLRAALGASRTGRRVVLAPELRVALQPTISENLRYLDLAVLWALWHECKLLDLLASVLPRSQALVAEGKIIAALALHRLVDPRSKLAAERWYPTTALPELLGITSTQFNNTRLHRVLEHLDEGGEALQHQLASSIRRDNRTAALFLDVTDTWFYGDGPKLAQRSLTKEGFYRRRIGIVLLCDEQGLPLRWAVVEGKRPDDQVMTEMVRAIANISWIGTSPLVIDRAMGKAHSVQFLVDSGVRFLTALCHNEFEAYSSAIPWQSFAEVQPGPDDAAEHARAGTLAATAGLLKVSENLYVLDLGTVEHGAGPLHPTVTLDTRAAISARDALAAARCMRGELDRGEAVSFQDLARRHGRVKSEVAKYLGLLQLPADIQRALDAGDVVLSLRAAHRIRGAGDAAAQRDALAKTLAKRRHAPVKAATGAPCGPTAMPLQVRGVVYFNPELFVGQRRHAHERLERARTAVAELNTKLAVNRSRYSEGSVHRAVGRILDRHQFHDLFDVAVARSADGSFAAQVTLKPEAWKRRRRYDGFAFLVAHPETTLDAPELCRLYRSKDAVEKDFEAIKSILRVRPVRHRTDGKVRAHVTLCMLALMLERTLERRLRETGAPLSAVSAIETLRTCHLNRVQLNHEIRYVVTRPTPEQRDLLIRLGLAHLVDDAAVEESLTPR
jgi:transposase